MRATTKVAASSAPRDEAEAFDGARVVAAVTGSVLSCTWPQLNCGPPRNPLWMRWTCEHYVHDGVIGAEVIMLSGSVITTIIQVRDGSDAVEFYRDRLGLDYHGRNTEGQEMFSVGGGSGLALMPGPDATPTGRTELSFEVPDIVAEIKDLERRGVTFADYDLPGLKTVDHVCVLGSEKAAWFQDPDGNVLCLDEVMPGPQH